MTVSHAASAAALIHAAAEHDRCAFLDQMVAASLEVDVWPRRVARRKATVTAAICGQS